MLHEVLLSLLGHPGSIIQEEEPTGSATSDGLKSGSTFRVPDTITFLTATERAAINRVVGIGSIYRDLRKFVTPRALLWEEGGCSASGVDASSGREGDGLYLRALKLGVVEVLDEYAERVAEVERDVMTDPTLTLARVYAGVREYTSVLPAVAEACVAVTGDQGRGRLKGPQLLEILHERSHFGAPDVRQRLRRLVWYCSQVLMNQCVSWLLHGLVVDPCNEFFVQKNAQPNGGSVRPALSAGFDGLGNERHAAFEEGDEAASRRVDDWGGEEEWNSTYTVRLALVPTTFVPHRLAQKMLFVGKVVRVLRQASPQDISAQQTAPFAGWPSEPGMKVSSPKAALKRDGAGGGGSGGMGVSEAEVLELTQRWSDLCDRESFNLLAVERAVHEAHALVDRRLYRLLVNVSGFEKHVAILKGLFLMGHGALFHSFFDKARMAMRTPAGDRAVLDLNMWLAAAAEDNEGGHASLPSSENALSRAIIALDPSGFTCKTFHDLAKQGFCVTGRARPIPKKSGVCLCPGGPDTRPPPKEPPSSAPPGPEPRIGPGGGSLWYTSDRELPRGFMSSVAFRCDRTQHNAKESSGEEKGAGPVGGWGSVSLVIHNHRPSLAAGGERGGEDGRGGEAAAVPNSLSVRLEPDGDGGGQVELRWNPHLPPSFPPSATGASSDFRVISLDDPSAGRGSQLRTLGHATLPRSCGLSLGHVNYLAVDYALGEVRPTRKPRGDEEEAASGKEARPSARLRVFVNDPGRLGSAVLSVAVDLWALIEMGGGRAFVGVSAEGPWKTTLRQWEFRLGSAAAAGKTSGPLGGIGSGPKVEKMVEAMDSWNGLCLDYSGQTNNEKAWLGPLWMLRARMAFFVTNLAFYLQVDVVEAAHTVLKAKLETVRDFVSLQRAHQDMLSTLRAKFYLDNLEISQGLGRALRHVLRFCCLFALHGDVKDISSSEVTALHQAFQDEMKILIPVLERLAKELAMRLDFNGHFSVEVL
eukprot:jgi/Undpi1/5528/HiC_scaffold_2.g00805.m2